MIVKLDISRGNHAFVTRLVSTQLHRLINVNVICSISQCLNSFLLSLEPIFCDSYFLRMILTFASQIQNQITSKNRHNVINTYRLLSLSILRNSQGRVTYVICSPIKNHQTICVNRQSVNAAVFCFLSHPFLLLLFSVKYLVRYQATLIMLIKLGI